MNSAAKGAGEPAGKKIVLLSDGTGNSSSAVTKTNVWRIYQAIDRSRGDQIAFYDDGVGSGGFKVLRYIGGIFGYGLARNVRQLYAELCRHYEPGDDIILIGFSRGAFTVRVLSGLIHCCGVIDRSSANTVARFKRSAQVAVNTDAGLKLAVDHAYRSLRLEFGNPPLAWLFRQVRRLFMETLTVDAFAEKYSIKPRPRIAFVGVFDTVSAYGLPIDEMAITIHNCLWPLRFPDMVACNSIDNAVQALALDEARQTFHPMMWSERDVRVGREGNAVSPKPLQVWFAGMHADVGGGYGDDTLAMLACRWMMRQSEKTVGLRFDPCALQHLDAQASELGAMHDSRSGFASFYRYKPRVLEHLGNEDMDGDGRRDVDIVRFRVHRAVFSRIADNDADYAPLGVPEDYDVVDDDGNIVSADDAGIETREQRSRRAAAQRQLADLVFWRRLAYLAMLAIALVIVVLPLVWLPNPAAVNDGLLSSGVGFFAWLITYLPLPKTDQIGAFWTERPGRLLALLAAYGALYLVAGWLAAKVQARLQAAWSHLGEAGSENSAADGPQWAYKLVTGNAWPYRLYKWWTKKALPAAALIVLVFLLFITPVWRLVLFQPFNGQSICAHMFKPGETPGETNGGEMNHFRLGEPFSFDTRQPCLHTGIPLVEGRIYEMTIKLADAWKDSTLPANPTGLENWSDWLMMLPFTLMRRFWSESWMSLMGSIGRGREFAFPIDPQRLKGKTDTYKARFHAWRTGRLYLFVNDAINAWKNERLCPTGMDKNHAWRCYYDNNKGTAMITVTEVGEK